jgi:hypothetical protein
MALVAGLHCRTTVMERNFSDLTLGRQQIQGPGEGAFTASIHPSSEKRTARSRNPAALGKVVPRA